MNRSRVAAIVLEDLYLYRGSPQRVFPMFVWVAVDILLWGFLTRYLNSVSRAEVNFVPALLGAVLLWDFLTRVMQGVTMAFFEDVWTRNFLNIFATPLRTSEYLAGIILVAVCTSLPEPRRHGGLCAAQPSACRSSTYGTALAPFLAVLFLTGIAFGVAAAAIVLRLGPASEWLIWPIPMIVSPFAGVFYPIAVLPAWMRAVAAAPAAVLRVRGDARGGQPASARRGTSSRSAAASRSSIWSSPASSSWRSTASPSAAASSPATAPRR